MAKVKFKFNLAGLNELMKSGEMQSIINDAAARIAGAAGEGYEIEPAHPIGYIAIGSVYAADWDAVRDNSENNTLQKAAGSVRI